MSSKIKKIIKYLIHPKGIIIFLASKNLIKMEDKKFLEEQFQFKMKYRLDLENPKTFNEKLQWLKLYDRKDIYTKMVDKYEAKKYVASIIGEEYIIPTLGVFDKFEDIDFSQLPDQFVIKCTHDSGGVVICKNKETFNYKQAKKKLEKKMKQNFYYKAREWPYKNVKPRIIVEKYMEDVNNEDLTDYKLMCFNGKVKCSFVCMERNSKSGLKIDFYDENWKKMNFERHYKNSNHKTKKPCNYEKMVEFSERLSKGIKFVRVDFYEIKDQLYFGKLTFYPGAGYEEFKPFEYDELLGSWINLEGEKNEI